MGHVCVTVYFFRFSLRGKAFIFNFSYLKVSVLLICKFLYIKNHNCNFALSNRKRITSAKLINNINQTK